MKRFLAKLVGKNMRQLHRKQIDIIKMTNTKTVLDIAPPRSIDLSKHIDAKYTSIGLIGNNVTEHVDIRHDLDVFPYPVKSGSYDIVIMSNILEHLNNPLKAMAEGMRITKEWLLIVQPVECHPTTTNPLGPRYGHKWRYRFYSMKTNLSDKDQIFLLLKKETKK